MWIVSNFSYGSIFDWTGKTWDYDAIHYSNCNIVVTVKETNTGETRKYVLRDGNKVAPSLLDPLSEFNPYGFGLTRCPTEVIGNYYCVGVDDLSLKFLDLVEEVRPSHRGTYVKMHQAGKGITNSYDIRNFSPLDNNLSLFYFQTNASDFVFHMTLLDVIITLPDWWCGDSYHMLNLTGQRLDTEFAYIVKFNKPEAAKRFVGKASTLRGKRIKSAVGKISR